MQKIAEELRKIVNDVSPLLESCLGASEKLDENKWSKKEIIGHLLDSACNNQQKFVRAMAQKHTDFVGYEQNHWVASQRHQNRDWNELVLFWKSFNLHLAHIIENVSSDLLSNTIAIDGSDPFTLEFIMADYNEHLKHHLKQILPDVNLESSFENLY